MDETRVSAQRGSTALLQKAFLESAIFDRHAIALLAAFYVAYMVAASFGHWLLVIPEIPITVWPPNGVTLAALLTNERGRWPWLLAVAAAGELTGNAIWFHNSILPAFGYVIVNALEVLAAAIAMSWFVKLPATRLLNLTQVLAFLWIGVVVAPMIGASLGSAIDQMVGKNPFQVTWPYWWLGDATGILIATPLVISLINIGRERKAPTKRDILEATAPGLLLVLLGSWIFFGDRPYAFILLLPILWAAIRFEMRGSAIAVLTLVMIIGLDAQDGAHHPFSGGSIHGSAAAQLFILTAASTGLIVAAIFRQFRQARMDLATANALLEQKVIERTAETRAAERRFKVTFENAAVGMSILDPAGTLVSVNDSLAQMLGYQTHQLEGNPLDEFTHPDDLPANDLAWQKLRSGITDSYALEKRYLRKDGQVVWGYTSVSCVRDSNGEIEYLIKVIQNITGRKQSDEARQLLMREVNHRSKNLLSVIQAIARQTAATTPPGEFLSRFGERLEAISASQDLLIESEWTSVGLEQVIRTQLAHIADDLGSRFDISGPPVHLSARAAQAIGMAMHELATNALKYGSLSAVTGRVRIDWQVTGEEFELSWKELNGPEAIEPGKTGFGSVVIDKMVRSALDAQVSIDYAADGLSWRLRGPVSMLQS